MLLLFPAVLAATWTVEADGRGDFETLTEAASVAAGGDTIVVGDGTFAGATFTTRVTVQGRNGAGSTTIDGGGYAALYAPDGIDVEAITLTSAGATALVVVGGGSLTDSVISGSGTAWASSGGGASFSNGEYSVEGSQFVGNQAYIGGAIYVAGISSRLTVSDSTFSSNYAGYGGGVGLEHGSALEVSDCEFDTNTAYYHGGGLYAPSLNAVLATGNTYTGNTAPAGWGGGIYAGAYGVFDARDERYVGNTAQYGGAVGAYYQTVTTSTVHYEGNSATAEGGAVILHVSPGSDTGSTYVGNSSAGTFGGAVHLDYSAFDFISPTFTENLTTGVRGGGALSLYNGAVVSVTNGVFSGNEAMYYGGAVSVYASAVLTTTDTTYDTNVAGYGGAVALESYAGLYQSNPSFTNNYSQAGGAVYAYYYCTIDEMGAVYADNTSYGSGGGLYTYYGVSVRERGASFVDGTATYGQGAHAYNYYYGSASYESTDFRTGLSYYDGGAIYAYALYDGGLSLRTVSLDDNAALYGSGGAAIVGYSSSLLMDTVTVTNNTAYYYGGGMSVTGGVPTTITGSSFEQNAAGYYAGGGLHWDAYGQQSGDFSMVDSEVKYNAADESGGGLYVAYPDLFQLTGTTLAGNVAGSEAFGGGLLLRMPTGGVLVDNNTISSNFAGFGGGVYVEGTVDLDVEDQWHNNILATNMAAVGGGACFVRGVTTHLTNNTLVGNAASAAGGGICASETVLELENTVVAYTAAGAALHLFDTSTASRLNAPYLNLYGNAAGDAGGELTTVPDNLAVDPGFVSWSDDGRDNDSFLLTAGSAMRDAGNPALKDADGTRSDIGAWGGPGLRRVDEDGDGHFNDTDCNDADNAVHPGAADAWYDDLDSDCVGNDDHDQDADGAPLDADCDDTDPSIAVPCADPAALEDSGPTDTATPDKPGDEACGCTNGASAAAFSPALLALALLRRRPAAAAGRYSSRRLTGR